MAPPRQRTGATGLSQVQVALLEPAPQTAEVGSTRSFGRLLLGVWVWHSHRARLSIRCNVLAPALVETPMAQRAAQDTTIQTYIKTKQPLDGGRIGQPSDLDGAVVYFMSDASKFTTGQVLAVDGGWTVNEGES